VVVSLIVQSQPRPPRLVWVSSIFLCRLYVMQECTICGRIYTRKDNLAAHRKSKHNGGTMPSQMPSKMPKAPPKEVRSLAKKPAVAKGGGRSGRSSPTASAAGCASDHVRCVSSIFRRASSILSHMHDRHVHVESRPGRQLLVWQRPVCRHPLFGGARHVGVPFGGAHHAIVPYDSALPGPAPICQSSERKKT
jgi:hypothetical protein